MANVGVGYRPRVERDKTPPSSKRIADSIENIEAIINRLEKDQGKVDDVTPQDRDGYTYYTFEQMVKLTHQETVSAQQLDTMLRSVYDFGEQVEVKAQFLRDILAEKIPNGIPVDDRFKEAQNVDRDCLLLFGAKCDKFDLEMMDCLNTILRSKERDTVPMERDDSSAGATSNAGSDRKKFEDISSVEKALDRVDELVPKFGLEFLLMIVIVCAEQIIALILKPLCAFTIIGIKVGKAIVKLITRPLYISTLKLIDLRKICDNCNVSDEKVESDSDLDAAIKSSGCDDGRDETLAERVAEKWDSLPNLFRGSQAGYAIDPNIPPFCNDPERSPNNYEIAAALNLDRKLREMVMRDPEINEDAQDFLSYAKAGLAKNEGFALKASAANVQDNIRLTGGKGVGVNANLKLQGKSPAAQFISPKFQKQTLLMLNQMLQDIQALDKMIRSLTSLTFVNSRVADMICCFIRLMFAYAVRLSQEEDSVLFNPEFENQFQNFLAEMANQNLGTGFAEEFNKTNADLKNQPNAQKWINETTKIIKVLEAIISAFSSQISVDLNFGLNLDFKMLADSIIGTVGKSLTTVVDALMLAIKEPTVKFMNSALADPNISRAMEGCEIFKLMLGFSTCSIEAVHTFLLKLIGGFQRDINENWLSIDASITAQYNQKVTSILRDILNLILNDYYLFFTICNIDRMYTPEELRKASEGVLDALNIPKAIELQLDNQDKINIIYTPIAPDGIKTGQQGEITENNVADTFGVDIGYDFVKPLENVNDVLLDAGLADIKNRTADAATNPFVDERAESEDNIRKTLEELTPEIAYDNIVSRACAKCDLFPLNMYDTFTGFKSISRAATKTI